MMQRQQELGAVLTGRISISVIILGTVRQAESSAREFSPARKIRLFLGSLSSSRNHARSPPDDFLISLPDC